MKATLHSFKLTFPEDRKLKLPVESTTVTVDGQELALVQVKRPARKKTLLRPRKKTAAAAATSVPAPAAALAAGKQPEPEAKQPASDPSETDKQA
jgi:hypothetical protein